MTTTLLLQPALQQFSTYPDAEKTCVALYMYITCLLCISSTTGERLPLAAAFLIAVQVKNPWHVEQSRLHKARLKKRLFGTALAVDGLISVDVWGTVPCLRDRANIVGRR
jgi:hypothetical protein